MDTEALACCVECFADDVPRAEVTDHGRVGACFFCGSSDVPVCAPKALHGLFAPLMEYYEGVQYGTHYLDPDSEPTSHGATLGQLLQDHWDIFSDGLVSRNGHEDLIAAILDVDTRDLWTTVDDRWYVEPDEEGASWQRLAHHLKTERRFILDAGKSGFSDLRDRLQLVLEETTHDVDRGTHMYRSRAGTSVEGDLLVPYGTADIGAPDPSPLLSGRANPPGISYLYVSTDKETAVAEQRVGVGALVSLATLRVRRDLRLADLSDVRGLSSPFGVEHLAWAIRSRELLGALGHQLSRPVTKEDSLLEYVPSQFLCELILDLGYDGVVYGSGYGPGRNVVLFDRAAAKPICTEIAEVTRSAISLDLHEALWNE